jgi:60 kDa SS-A/Ro ribonucleoprotein
MKFNAKKITKKLSLHKDAILNHEGGLAFKPSSELDLYLRACNCLIEDRYYSRSEQELTALRTLIQSCDRSYVLKLANYARNKMHLRTLPLILLAEASVLHKGDSKEEKSDVRKYVTKIIRRADEPGELLAYWIRYLGKGKKTKLPNALKKGLSDAMNRFDAYQLAKYDRSAEIKLRDVLILTHAKPDCLEKARLYKQVLENKLAKPETWEVVISTEGSTTETWNKIAPKMGIMALLRNLRNFEQNNAQEAIVQAIKVFKDPERIQASKLLPFRWLAAEREIKCTQLKQTLREALQLSLANLPVWEGKTAIFVDLSGSMNTALSMRSQLKYIDIAVLMGAMATYLSQAETLVGAFGETYQDIELSRQDSILSNAKRIINTDVGHSTNAWLSIESLRKRKRVFDRVVLLSDMQCYSNRGNQTLIEEWYRYRQTVNPDAILYSIDLAGYGQMQFPETDTGVVQLAGWSDRVLEMVAAFEGGENAIELIMADY